MSANLASQGNEQEIALEVVNLSKQYGQFTALDNVSLRLKQGTIHGLLGENGAGKSTLVGLISGQNTATSGSIILDGLRVEDADVREMEQAGVFLVTQEPMIVDHLTAAENLMLGIWPSNHGLVQWGKLESDAQEMLEGTGIDHNTLAGQLDAVARRKLNILRAMFSGGKVIILDEPTTSLSVEDRTHLFDFMRRLKRQGVTFIFISHYNDEILSVCDAVSVLRDGKLAGSSEHVDQLSSEDLSELVVGHNLSLFQREPHSFQQLEEGASFKGIHSDGVHLEHLHIATGEIVGFTGLPGSGAKETARAIFGLQPAKGFIKLGSQSARALPQDPHDAFDAGIAFLSDDRRKDGLLGQMSIEQNISLSCLTHLSHSGFIDSEQEHRICEQYFASMNIKAANSEALVDTLSGGNQQKVCLGRVLATKPKLLILDEPTRGIDIGVKQDVLRIIDELSESGVCVIIVSTDTDELARITDRVCVFEQGSIRRELTGSELTSNSLRAKE
ncbi:putative Monosaccharide-transporting ATPase [Vibrio nigripulchritudo SO65]|uniref:sugar ABC transporter ATP-binding protein n=1 Tax=Vibrio nigripulchritudo TaxID=28173 RepID=UPI0003B18EAB|nr:sugar ABC transporter ATP-binding protein [Vibrio nigripulchritudo]CCN34554.1 putative Monosaccharide-transporting ATPase [Vibrio nigripulchritudo AM115]CCN42176.1 putative Monosaccharide-transporting ATPase [Vibrio nigripulchritudo FTn2]CCN75555.1 putative Monosaccharide-transporting ATPase [Vibrio nigripulchritudo SO65]